MKQRPKEKEKMSHSLASVVNLREFPLQDESFQQECKQAVDTDGALVLPGFLNAEAIDTIREDGADNQHLAYYTETSHNIYLTPPDPGYSPDHPRNREILSSKGCITTDQIPVGSALHALYEAPAFRQFLCAVFGEDALYEYADPLSSINLHYASDGQELGWHFDNSSFAITLLIQNPVGGGEFLYVKDVRDADRGEMNYEMAAQVLDGDVEPKKLTTGAGALVLFRGRNSMHRVTPTIGDRTRMLVVLAYNTEPDIALSESARLTFFGRLG